MYCPRLWKWVAKLPLHVPAAGCPAGLAAISSYVGQCTIGGQDYCSNCAPKHALDGVEVGIYMSDISAFWMAFPYMLTGLGEALVQPVLQYYAYSCTPKTCRAFVQALALVFSGMYPLSLVTVFTTLLKHHLQNNLNNKTDDVLGLSLGLEVFYYIALVFAIIGIPVTYFILSKVRMEPVSDIGNDELEQALATSDSNVLSECSDPHNGEGFKAIEYNK